MTRMQFLLHLVRPHKGRLTAAILLTCLASVVALLPPLAMRHLINDVAIPAQKNFTLWQQLPLAIAFIVSIPIINGLFNAFMRIFIGAIGQRLIVDLRTNFYRHILDLSLRFHGERGSGFVMNRLMGDISMVQNLVTGETLGILSSFVALTFSIAMAFTLQWKLAPILIIIIALYVFNYRMISNKIRQANLDLREVMDVLTGKLQERLAGVRLVKTYCRERDETGDFLTSTNRALEHSFRGEMLTVYLSTSARLISGVGATCIWAGCGWFVIQGTMQYGDLYAMNLYVWQAIHPAVSMTMVAGAITQAMVSIDRIIEILEQKSDVVEKPDAIDLPECRGELALENIHFAYKEDEPLFSGLTHVLKPGKMTALVGHTGCGKTTITSLLLRLWDVQKGKITLDGYDVRDLTIRSLRRHTGVVPQEPVIFEGTVFENIAYAMPEATLEQVTEAAEAAQIHDVIMALPDGYNTILGKDGSKLSVGEKQRVAIARAIVRKPAVFILDEATSSLDSESELLLQKAMLNVLKGRTSVVVAHRLSTIVEADEILVMDKGNIIEQGTHDELMDIEDGYYRLLYDELSGKNANGGAA
jgi:ABC-type multidrug transport system fused ATPase/permease subunit